jgi:acid phosphatase family membrane protein YuiD
MFTPSPGDIPIKALIAVLAAWLLAGAVKLVIQFFKGEPVTFFTLGGMPSVHSAIVGSLFISVYFETGLSLLLLIVGVFGGVVFRDAWGVRWEVTRHSRALNKLLLTEEYERTGHTKLEAAIGAIFGFLVATLAYAVL